MALKSKTLTRALQAIGVLGTAVVVGLFVAEPSFPTPDKIIVFLLFVFMIFHQAGEMLKRLLPFVVMILLYESFRGIADQLNSNVNFTFPPAADRWLFGELPTVTLQNILWNGQTQWYDFALYFPYMLFFVVPIALAILVWKKREYYYWNGVGIYVTLLFMAFLTFLLFPAAPPWMAAEQGYIEPIHRISTDVWYGLGIRDFPTLYQHIAPNPVAAVPSLHSAMGVLSSILVFRLFGPKWGAFSLIYPLSNIFGIIYQGEHYVFDAILGTAYAFAAYFSGPHIVRFVARTWDKLMNSRIIKMGLKKVRATLNSPSR